MRHFALLIGLLLLASGCLHPDDDEANQTPKAKADTEGGGRTFEPDAEIWFTPTYRLLLSEEGWGHSGVQYQNGFKKQNVSKLGSKDFGYKPI